MYINLSFIIIIGLHLSSLPKGYAILEGDPTLSIFHLSGKHNKKRTT